MQNHDMNEKNYEKFENLFEIAGKYGIIKEAHE